MSYDPRVLDVDALGRISESGSPERQDSEILAS